MSKIKYCKRPGFLKGGMGQHMDPSKIDPKILAMGIKVELEHTKNKCAAMWISLDHYAEHGSGYYPALAKMERKLSKSKP
jgi:hypothetical protein